MIPPYRLPFIGMLPWMLTNPLRFLTTMARTQGHVVDFGMWGNQRTYFVAHPDAVQHVLQNAADNYIKGKGFEPMKLLTGEGLVTAEGKRWRRNRQLVQPAFHRKKVIALIDTIVDVALETSDRWARNATGNLDLSVEMTSLTRSVLMRAVLGVKDPNQVQNLSQAWEDAFAFVSNRLLLPFAPPIEWPTPGNIKFRRARATLDEATYAILREKRSSSTPSDDLLSLLLESRDAETGEILSDQDVRDEVMTFFAGGFETSATTLAWMFHLLFEHPEIARRVKQELFEVLGDGRPTGDDIARLVYLKAVVQETLRLYPGAWIFLPSNIEEDEIGPTKIAKNARIVLSPHATHRMPEFWEKPDEFIPDRFLDESANKRPRFAYFPFGGGARQCIGEVFALTEMIAIAAVLLVRHHFDPVPGQTITPKPMGTLRPDRGPLVRISKRV